MSDCCPDRSLSAELSFQHDGDVVEVVGDCLNCGATVKDSFTYATTEVIDETATAPE